MMPLSQVLAGLPAFLLCFALGLVLLAAFLVIYLAVTPYNEIGLIRDGNAAAAISLGGATLGYVLPLSRAIAQSVSVVDMLAWGLIALVVQVAVYFVAARAIPHFPEAIKAGRISGATFLAAMAIAVGLLNAAAMTS
jgi:putative membrane protein